MLVATYGQEVEMEKAEQRDSAGLVFFLWAGCALLALVLSITSIDPLTKIGGYSAIFAINFLSWIILIESDPYPDKPCSCLAFVMVLFTTMVEIVVFGVIPVVVILAISAGVPEWETLQFFGAIIFVLSGFITSLLAQRG